MPIKKGFHGSPKRQAKRQCSKRDRNQYCARYRARSFYWKLKGSLDVHEHATHNEITD